MCVCVTLRQYLVLANLTFRACAVGSARVRALWWLCEDWLRRVIELAERRGHTVRAKELGRRTACCTWLFTAVTGDWFSCSVTVLDFLFSFSHPQTLAFHIPNISWSFNIQLQCSLLSECRSAPRQHPPPTMQIYGCLPNAALAPDAHH